MYTYSQSQPRTAQSMQPRAIACRIVLLLGIERNEELRKIVQLYLSVESLVPSGVGLAVLTTMDSARYSVYLTYDLI